MTSPLKRAWPFIWINFHLSPYDAFWKVWLKSAHCFWRRWKYKKFTAMDKSWSEKLTEPGELKTSSVSFKFFLKNSPHPLEKFEISLNWLMYYSNIKLYESFMINQKRQNIPEAFEEGGGGCVIFIEIIANDIEEYVGLLTLQFRISICTFFKLEKN